MAEIITAHEKMLCAEREVKFRKRVYPRFIEEKKMSAGKAAHEIAVMEAIAEDYRLAAQNEQLL